MRCLPLEVPAVGSIALRIPSTSAKLGSVIELRMSLLLFDDHIARFAERVHIKGLEIGVSEERLRGCDGMPVFAFERRVYTVIVSLSSVLVGEDPPSLVMLDWLTFDLKAFEVWSPNAHGACLRVHCFLRNTVQPVTVRRTDLEFRAMMR